MEAVRTIPRDNSSIAGERSSRAAAEATFEFGRFRVLLRQRQLVTDGVPIELGSRAFDLLLVLLEANGSLVTKEELLSRVWPGIFVAEENLKVHISSRGSLDHRPGCLSARDAIGASVDAKLGSPMDFLATAARLVRRRSLRQSF